MKQNKFKTRYNKLIEKQKLLNEQINSLQNECTHENLEYKFRGYTGNYDSTLDRYWIEWFCNDCNKKWTTPQNKIETNKYPKAINKTYE